MKYRKERRLVSGEIEPYADIENTQGKCFDLLVVVG